MAYRLATMGVEELGLDLWNVASNTECLAGAQSIFNIVGRVAAVERAERLTYALNGGLEMPVAVHGITTGGKRLARAGDFNIDTIAVDDLRRSNHLRLRLYGRRGEVSQVDRDFRVRLVDAGEPRWTMDLHDADAAQEVGQIVDGRWQLGTETGGRRYLGIAPGDAGYDRVFLVGHRDWAAGYEVRSRFRVDAWTRSISQGVGCAFKWNAHRRGDGGQLPEEWSTGVAWAFSESPGLTIRFGINATKDAGGRWSGESVLAEGTLSSVRAWISRLSRRVAPTVYALPQIVAGVEYGYHLVVADQRLALTIWEARQRQPEPQVVAEDAGGRLTRGSVGVIAHHCGVRVYELSVTPLSREEAMVCGTP